MNFGFRESEGVFGHGKKLQDLFPLHRGKLLQELIHRIAAAQILKQILYRHPCTGEDGFTALDIWRNGHDAIHNMIVSESSLFLNHHAAS
jgi:hypothetical protein